MAGLLLGGEVFYSLDLFMLFICCSLFLIWFVLVIYYFEWLLGLILFALHGCFGVIGL